ncbi:hypothetical protein PUNSTDRAFT_19762, partial [Punctularia strigosozonata HHB-11173 SS5]|uniref:uncharacterized protein n=1 Tax=Punctularia strigosozonata (strain HHB-11173) TaxID=741275 RepID=UPI0004417D7C
VEDGAPAHRSALANQARSQLGIKSLPHPASSPDLNPIEPIWLLLKSCVADIQGSSRSIEALQSAVREAWDGISDKDVERHTSQMDARVEAVKKARGWHTKF